jgi:glutamate/aspartate transport system permease protein
MVILWFFLLMPLMTGMGYERPMGAELSAMITFTLFEAAYFSRDHARRHPERPKGQVHAGYALGMTYRQTMQLVVLPQAFRNMLPVLLTQTIILFQDTSWSTPSAPTTCSRASRSPARTSTGPIETYLVAAVVYFVICFSLSMPCGGCRRIAIIR